jgi:hypothetical protein
MEHIYIYTYIPTFLMAFALTFYQAFYLASILTYFLAFILTFSSGSLFGIPQACPAASGAGGVVFGGRGGKIRRGRGPGRWGKKS